MVDMKLIAFKICKHIGKRKAALNLRKNKG